MICPNCKTKNDDQYVFCVNCGANITPSEDVVPATVREVRPQAINYTAENSVPTVFAPRGGYRPAPLKQPDQIHQPQTTRRGPVGKIIAALVVAVVLLGILGVGAFLVFTWPKTNAEALPDHLGMFAQSADKNQLSEIKKLDFSNALEGKDNLLKDESLPSLEANPTLILYSDGKDVPVSDLHLIQLDTIKDDGSFKQIDFQASPIENKPEMKKLKIPNGIANGKYAFALIDGFLNDGKHKFWAFQVRNATRGDNGNTLRGVTVAMKPTPMPSPTPTAKTPAPTPSAVPPPPGATVAYTTTSNLVLRIGPSQDATKLRNLRRGEKVYVFRYSENSEVFNGIQSKFAYIQTENGQTGWVFAAFLR
jgi:hypothetical protein